MMYWHTDSDGSMSRKLKAEWNEEEKALAARHAVFLKEAASLGYAVRLCIDTLQWGVKTQNREWVGLTDEEIDRVTDAQWAKGANKPIYAAHRAYARAIEAKLKEKNT